jgi:hypothetical protein
LQGIAQNHPVRPIDVVLIKLNGFPITQLRIGEQIALHVLSGRDLDDGLRGDALVDVQRHRLHFKRPLLPLARPLQPRLPNTQRLRQQPRFFLGQRPLPRRFQQFRPAVRRSTGIEAQQRRPMRIVVVANAPRLRQLALRRQSRRRDVLARRVEPIIGDGLGWIGRRGYGFPDAGGPSAFSLAAICTA